MSIRKLVAAQALLVNSYLLGTAKACAAKKLTSVDKWRQGAWPVRALQNFFLCCETQSCTGEITRFYGLSRGFRLMESIPEPAYCCNSSTGVAIGMRMEAYTSAPGSEGKSPAGPPAVAGSHLNRNSKTVQQIFETHRSRLYELMVNTDLSVRSEELELHFASMPLRYWPRVDSAALRWHLELVHEFVDGLTRSDVLLAPPVIHWRHFPDRGFSEVVVCTWDRLGLLAKIAGSFAATGLNIVRADIYTRSDNIVLDVFQVCDEELRHVEDISRLKQMEQLLTIALSPNGDGEAVLRTWMQYAGEPMTADSPASGNAPVLTFDNDRFDDYTVLQVEAPDRVGLLHDLLQAISTCDVDIVHAVIVTEEGEAADVFFMTGTDGRKIRDGARLEQIRDAVRATLE